MNINFGYVFDVLSAGVVIACIVGGIVAGAYTIGYAYSFYPISTLIAALIVLSFALGWRLVENKR